MALIVQKYGGTSVGNPERILNVAKRVIATQEAGHDVVVVVRAHHVHNRVCLADVGEKLVAETLARVRARDEPLARPSVAMLTRWTRTSSEIPIRRAERSMARPTEACSTR